MLMNSTTIKRPRPDFISKIKGTRAFTISSSRGTTLLVFHSHLPVLMRSRSHGDTRPYCIVAQVERPLISVMLLRGNHPPCPTCTADRRASMPAFFGLSSVSRSRGGSERAHPFRTFTNHRIAVGHRSHTMFASTRVSLYTLVVVLRIPADRRNVNQYVVL